jgi:DNA-binding PadR family transcriptional regulator
MPEPKPTPELPSNDLILAAIERAVCHRGRNEPAESLSSIKEHLGLPHNGWTTLQIRPKLEELEAAGLIEKSRRSSSDVWGLTAKGRRRLGAVRRRLTLPESRQHRIWREARIAAAERITGFRGDLRSALDEAIALLDTDQEADSATWYECSESLHQSGRRLASAIHCLREWPEPDDSKPDTDDPPYRQRGRRHTRGWDSEFQF